VGWRRSCHVSSPIDRPLRGGDRRSQRCCLTGPRRGARGTAASFRTSSCTRSHFARGPARGRARPIEMRITDLGASLALPQRSICGSDGGGPRDAWSSASSTASLRAFGRPLSGQCRSDGERVGGRDGKHSWHRGVPSDSARRQMDHGAGDFPGSWSVPHRCGPLIATCVGSACRIRPSGSDGRYSRCPVRAWLRSSCCHETRPVGASRRADL
jgi:hypothetical protein